MGDVVLVPVELPAVPPVAEPDMPELLPVVPWFAEPVVPLAAASLEDWLAPELLDPEVLDVSLELEP